MGGQAIGLPFFMAAFSFVSIAITSCSVVIFGVGVSDPIALLAKMNNGPITTLLAMTGLLVATLSTNIAAGLYKWTPPDPQRQRRLVSTLELLEPIK
jgi:NCS1 family nucleobase:cation symporter-1